MNRRTLLGVTFTLALAALPACAYAQAAAESAVLKAGSAAATVKAGSALNSAMHRGGKKLAERVQRPASQPARGKTSKAEAQPVSTSPAQDTAGREGTTPAQGLVIASIQGGENSCAPADPKAATPGSQSASQSAQTTPGDRECVGKPAPQGHKSVIALSFSK